MAKVEIQKHRILREVYRHYMEFRDLVMSPEQDGLGGFGTSDGVITHGYYHQPTREIRQAGNTLPAGAISKGKFDKENKEWVFTVPDGPRLKIVVTFSFWDLHDQLSKLSRRKRQAVFYNVILDQKQKDVAQIMGITTVSVGQYVEQGMLQVADTGIIEVQIEEV